MRCTECNKKLDPKIEEFWISPDGKPLCSNCHEWGLRSGDLKCPECKGAGLKDYEAGLVRLRCPECTGRGTVVYAKVEKTEEKADAVEEPKPTRKRSKKPADAAGSPNTSKRSSTSKSKARKSSK